MCKDGHSGRGQSVHFCYHTIKILKIAMGMLII